MDDLISRLIMMHNNCVQIGYNLLDLDLEKDRDKVDKIRKLIKEELQRNGKFK